MPVHVNEAILRKIIRNHGVEQRSFGDLILASFGKRLTVEVSADEMKYLSAINDEEN